MNICGEHGGEDIAFEGRDCPACIERDEMQAEIDAGDAEVKELNDQIGKLEAELAQI